MFRSPSVSLIVLVLLVVVAVVSGWAVLAARARLEVRAGRRRARRGLAAERDAAVMLERRGFRVVRRHPPLRYRLDVDGEPQDVALTADLLVERAGRRWLAEVKTGEDATRWSHGGTRRQLLEYQLASGHDSVLLVDPARERVQELRFAPVTAQPASANTWWWGLLIGLGIGFWVGLVAR